MSQFTNNPGRNITAGGTITEHLLVKADGTLTAADANRDWIGSSLEPRTSGQSLPIRFASAGSHKLTAAAAISAGAIVYKAANGQIGTTNTNARVGIALEAASGAGSIIEVVLD